MESGERRTSTDTLVPLPSIAFWRVGGVLGVVMGVSLPIIVSHFASIETVVSVWSIALAFGISVGIGVIFGIYPARRAALMDPIEALRHE